MKNGSYDRQLSVTLFGIWTLLALIFAGIAYFAAASENRMVSTYSILLNSLGRFYLWAVLSPLIFQIVKRFDFGTPKNSSSVFLIHIASGFLFSILHTTVYICLIWFWDESNRQQFTTLANFFQPSVFYSGVYLGILLYILIVIAFQSILLFRRYREEEARNLELKAELVQSQLRALKMQLQPHFLFNTLHSIASLNLVDPQRANTMISRLGEFLRMTLDHDEEPLVPLSKELEFARCYLEIEQTRFSDRLSIEFDVEPIALAVEVPHLILQPLVENAVKHGIAPHSLPGRISISAKSNDSMLTVTISDNGSGIVENGKENTETQNGRGLQNVCSRLTQIYGENYTFELRTGNNAGTSVILKIPVSPESIKAVEI